MPGIFDQMMGAFGTAGAAFFTTMFLIAACNPASDAVTGTGSCIAGVGMVAAGAIGGPAAAGDLGDPGDGVEDDDPTGIGCGGDSFTPDTPVLTAAGNAVPISALKTGEKIQSVNTATGKNETQTVDAVLVNHDTDLYDLTIRTTHGNTVIHTTSNHPFWDDATHTWIEAGKLHPGERLHTADGTEAVVGGGVTPENTVGWMWDLTVSNDHDFYVIAGSTAVLVHNCDTAPSTWTPDENYSPDAVNARSAANQAYYGTPQEVHNTVSAIEGGSISQRISGGLPDSYQVRNSTLVATDGGEVPLCTLASEGRRR